MTALTTLTTGHILTIALAILGGMGTLVGVIWSMHNKRVDAIDRRVDRNQKSMEDMGTRLFTKFDEVKDGISTVSTHMQGLRADIAERYISQDDCRRCREQA